MGEYADLEFELMGDQWLDDLEQLFGGGTTTPPPPKDQPKKQWHMADPDQPAFIQKCPLCQGSMAERNGKNGPFLGCKSYPNCKGTRNYPRVDNKY